MADRKYLPWLPIQVVEGQPVTHLELRKPDVAALQAVAAGIANADQQKMAIAALFHMTAIGDLEFLPDEHGGERGSTFKGGIRHVGLQLRKLLTFPLTTLTGEKNDGPSHDRRTGKPEDDRNASRARS